MPPTGAEDPGEAGAAATQDPFLLGFVVPNYAGFEAFGSAGSDTANSDNAGEQQDAARAEIAALVQWANDTGGLNGQPIEARTREVTFAEATQESALAAHCVGFTEDMHVSAVIDYTYLANVPSVVECFADHQTLLMGGTLSILSDAFIRQSAPYVASTSPSLTRTLAALVPGLDAAGYFEGTAGVAVLMDDSSQVVEAYETEVAPRLAALGITPQVFSFTTDGSQAGPQGSAAVLQMRAAGVTHVINIINFLNYLGVMTAADSQAYYPRWGFGDYAEGASIAGFYGTETQNARAIAVSSSDGYVLRPEQERPRPLSEDINPDEVNPGMRRCLDTLGEYRGQDYYASSSGRSLAVAYYCNNFFLFIEGARQLQGATTSDTWHTGLERVGSGYASTVTVQTFFGPDIYDGASHYLIGEYSEVAGCKCFIRLTDPLAFPPR